MKYRPFSEMSPNDSNFDFITYLPISGHFKQNPRYTYIRQLLKY